MIMTDELSYGWENPTSTTSSQIQGWVTLQGAPSLRDAVRVRVYVPQRNCQKNWYFWVSRPSTQPTFWLRHPTKV